MQAPMSDQEDVELQEGPVDIATRRRGDASSFTRWLVGRNVQPIEWNTPGPVWDDFVESASRVFGQVEIRPGHVEALRGYLKKIDGTYDDKLIIGDRSKRLQFRRQIELFLLTKQDEAFAAQDAIDAAKHRERVGEAGEAYVPLAHLPITGQVLDDLHTRTRGLGVLDHLCEREDVTDIFVYRWNHVRYLSLKRDKYRGQHRIAEPFPTPEAYDAIVRQLLSAGNVQAKASEPVIKFTINNFLRVHYVGGDVSQSGSAVLTLRKYRRKPLSIAELIAGGTITVEAANCLRAVIDAKISMILGGPPGSGKTTLMQALLWWMATGSQFIQQGRDLAVHNAQLRQAPYGNVIERRVVVIEDECELVLPEWSPVVQLASQRHPENPNHPATMARLVQHLVWEAPDLIVLGEVTDGPAASSAIEAMTVGRPVITTSHGREASDVLERWHTWCLMAGSQFDSATVDQRMATAIGYVVLLTDGYERMGEILAPKSIVVGIEEVRVGSSGKLTTVPVFVLDEHCRLVPAPGYAPRPDFARRGIRAPRGTPAPARIDQESVA